MAPVSRLTADLARDSSESLVFSIPVRPFRDSTQIKNDNSIMKIMKQLKRDKQKVSEIRRSSWGNEKSYVKDMELIEHS